MLIDQNTGAWNWCILSQIFLPVDVERICKIPSSSTSKADVLVWHFDSQGRYALKSGYRVALRLLSPNLSAISTSVPALNVWTVIWHLQAPPKVLSFLWRAVLDVLPTPLTLQRLISFNMYICGYGESILHLCRDCVAIRSVRSHVGLPHILQLSDIALSHDSMRHLRSLRLLMDVGMSIKIEVDSIFTVLASTSKTVVGNWDVVVAEAHAIAHGFQLTTDLRFLHLIVESNCKQVVDLLKMGRHFETGLSMAIADCVQL
ncbi:hypothetical protein GH714_021397 [Hevea brasiliensis]|uniref:Reverse transcriptase zinc-binding domain-containing protein n=1 Tax=Hevea brasiliensis TaxID=3981 RepID=A0A6A6LA56_HEVBR|nr:hypothetical protein GH714_021397 [Hevea brasiliensis]